MCGYGNTIQLHSSTELLSAYCYTNVTTETSLIGLLRWRVPNKTDDVIQAAATGDESLGLVVASIALAALVAAVGRWAVAQSRRISVLETAAQQQLKGQPQCGGVAALPAASGPVPQPHSRNTLYGRTAAEEAAGVQPSNYSFPPGDCRRFGYDPSGSSDSADAINMALRVPGQALLVEGVALISSPITLRSHSSLVGVGSGPYNEHDPVRGSVLRPVASFVGPAAVVLDPATEGTQAYINGVGLSNFCVDMTAVTQRKMIGIQVLSAADPGVFQNLKVMNQDTGHFVYVGQSANKGALQSEGIIFDNLLCLSLGIDPPNADAGVIVEASNEIHFRSGKVDRRSNGQHFPGSAGMLVRPSASGVTVNAMTSSQMSYAGWETGKKVVSSPTAGQGPRWIRCNYCTFEGPRYGFAVFGAKGRPSQFCSAIGNRQQTACGDQPAVLYLGPFCCNGTFEQDEDPGFHPMGAGPEHTVYAAANSEGNTISCGASVRDLGIRNLVLGRDPSGALSVLALDVKTIIAQPLQTPHLTNNWVQFSCDAGTLFPLRFAQSLDLTFRVIVVVGSASNRSAVGFWLDPLRCVHLQGHVAQGTLHTPVFTLPLGLRPAKDKSFAVALRPNAASAIPLAEANASVGCRGSVGSVVRVSQAGDVVVDAGSNKWVALDGVSFRAGD